MDTNMASPSAIEKESLEAHVELCAIRYGSLEQKLSSLDQRMDKLEDLILDIKDSVGSASSKQNSQTISIFTSVVGVLVAGIIGFISKGIFK